ncbi:MAG TPA: hypothetical protein VIH59_09785 [Candidatus Tectomicrobia bacterium]|jgi:hypothetical protein
MQRAAEHADPSTTKPYDQQGYNPEKNISFEEELPFLKVIYGANRECASSAPVQLMLLEASIQAAPIAPAR